MVRLKIPVGPNDHLEGNKDALITVVEYGDYQCPFCAQAHLVVKQIEEEMSDQVRFVFRNFPLTEIHPYAEVAAESAEFADTKGSFWEMHDLIFENQDSLGIPLLMEIAEQLNLNSQELQHALNQRIFSSKVKKDFMSGVRSGVNGTPTFFINDERYNGPAESLQAALKSMYV